MTQEQLRMQMLAGIITESQYKAILNENEKDEYYKQLRKNSPDGRINMDQIFHYPGSEWRKPEPPSPKQQREYGRYLTHGYDGKLADLYNNGYEGPVILDNGKREWRKIKGGEEAIQRYLEIELDYYGNGKSTNYEDRGNYRETLKMKERYEELKNSGQLDTLKDIPD
jgi:hypothetical protein